VDDDDDDDGLGRITCDGELGRRRTDGRCSNSDQITGDDRTGRANGVY